MRRSHLESLTCPEVDSADEQDPPASPQTKKLPPDWFELRPFQYNGRVFVAALPCVCLTLALSGELLLWILVIGGLLIHFMQSGGSKRTAVLTYLCVFITGEVAVIYYALPLLWSSLYNIITILLLNMSVVMTGGWILIHFQEFIMEEPSFAEIIEMALFTIYPTVSVGVATCIVAMTVSSYYLPYYVIIHGFLILRLFVTPSMPSFRKQTQGLGVSSPKHFVIGHVEVSLLLIFYVSAPAEIFIVMNFWKLLTWATLLRLLHVVFLPCFLMTLLELRTWTEEFNMPHKYITYLRWTTGTASLFLSVVLIKDTVVSLSVYWLSLEIFAHVLLGWVVTKKGHSWQIVRIIFGLETMLMYIFAIHFTIPWNLKLPNLDLSWLSIMVISTAVLSVFCTLVCNRENPKLSSILLMAFFTILVYTESLLYNHQLYSGLMLLCSSICGVYLLVRLLNSGVVTWYGTWIGSSLHALKIPYLVEIVTRTSAQNESKLHLGVLVLTLVLSKLLFFERRGEISGRVAVTYITVLLASLTLSYQSLLQPLVYAFYGMTLTLLQSICIVFGLTAAVCLKLTLKHLRQIPTAQSLNILVLVIVGLLFILQPSSGLTQHNISCWLTVIAVPLAVAIILGLTSTNQSLFVGFAQSIIFGLAAGMRASVLLFSTASKLTILQYSLSCTAGAFILLMLWINSKQKHPNHQLFLKPALYFLAVVALLSYITELALVTKEKYDIGLKDLYTPCLQLNCAICIFLGAALRLHCVLLRSRDPFGFAANQVATICNLLTATAYILICMICPIEHWELWNSICSLILLNLQQDPDFLTTLSQNNRSGIVQIACLINIYSATLIRCDLFHTGIGLFPVLEIALLVVTLPVLMTFMQHQVVHGYQLNMKFIVFLTPPNVFYFVIGSSYTSWLLASGVLAAASFMMYSGNLFSSKKNETKM